MKLRLTPLWVAVTVTVAPMVTWPVGRSPSSRMTAWRRTRFDELEKELNFLKTTRSDEVAEMIKVARGFGDLSENSEYDEAKNEQGKLYSRISELENRLTVNFVS